VNKVNPRGYLGRQGWLWWALTQSGTVDTLMRRLPERRVATEPHHAEPPVDPRLPSVMQRIRSAVIQMPVARAETRPLRRLVRFAWRRLLPE